MPPFFIVLSGAEYQVFSDYLFIDSPDPLVANHLSTTPDTDGSHAV
ncbi:hypothetical protein [Lentilactobacillus hilgardii]|nr:hypothetical protein [Lentilactobacillus hilgardii]MCP9333840.1 hypothetical protein [Lentilactobacillus hilgardii]MCP9350429.1 hypothetical protein [Lentilactobacillus hilgardii]MCP9353345.1 hypothetical protein [Lentilactobacillus hilgardii]